MYHIMQKQQRYLLLKSCDTNALAPRCLLLCVPRENTLPADLSIDCLAKPISTVPAATSAQAGIPVGRGWQMALP